jgi:hypothetical protein
MTEEARLIEKLQRIEALFAGAASAGEREAAALARDRIRNRLREHQQTDPPEPKPNFRPSTEGKTCRSSRSDSVSLA